MILDRPTVPRKMTRIGVKQHKAEVEVPISPVMRSLLLFMIVALKYLSPHKNLMVLKNTLSFGVQSTDLELGTGIPLFGKRFPFTQSSCEVSTHLRS
jgi:hypothetical protein